MDIKLEVKWCGFIVRCQTSQPEAEDEDIYDMPPDEDEPQGSTYNKWILETFVHKHC